MLKGKKVLIGITGSIAAYKIITLTRLLVKEGVEVKIVMTNAATAFVSPLVLSTLSKNKVFHELATSDKWANHVELGRWADVMLVAPLSFNSLGKMANGLCDNLLLATYFSCTCPIVVAPAMDEDMWHHPVTKKNLDILKGYGNSIIDVNKGELASGLFGEGRMEEPEAIVTYLKASIFRGRDLKGKSVLITAGPTQEAIDPVRYISNHSSGKMGYAVAEAMFMAGADVTLISGPSHEKLEYGDITLKKVVSAEEMYEACMNKVADFDIFIMSAAVADYAPIEIALQKLKKQERDMSISLAKTKDILYAVGQVKTENQFLVGFALESNDELNYAKEKLVKKNADCIVLNSIRDKDAGFGYDTNKIAILDKNGDVTEFPLKSKKLVAADIVSHIISKIND